MPSVRTRFPPSPTGSLHVGGARTALFNYLFAKKHGGDFVLRIEDTDLERSDPEFEKDIFESLAWLGIIADASPEKGGPHAPYRQSERLASYTPYLEKLLNAGAAFYCFHSEAELEAEKKELMRAGKNPVHLCDGRERSRREQERLAEERESITRFKTPAGQTLSFTDLIRGEITFASDLIGDFSIAKATRETKSLGFSPLYNFAVTIDDAEMGISHVIRGEDHISNTPKQILLQEALGLGTPQYAHLPLILGPDRSKLSKRHGATAIREFRDAGYLPEALVNFMALLGWNPGTDQEIFSMAELVAQFDLAKVQKSGAAFNIEKLDWLNGEYIRRLTPERLAELLQPHLRRAGLINETFDQGLVRKVAALEQSRLKRLSEVGERADYFFREPDYDLELLRWKDMVRSEIAESLTKTSAWLKDIPEADFTAGQLEEFFFEKIGAGDKGVILWPLRAALTGKKASAGPFEVLEILGKFEGEKRVARALEKVQRN